MMLEAKNRVLEVDHLKAFKKQEELYIQDL
jgi:hypothetical protein